MRFLQKPTEHQDAPDRDHAAQKERNDRRRTSNEEISAYFSTKRALPEDGVMRSIEHPEHVPKEAAKETARPEAIKQRSPPPPVELLSRPFLGFGSKGGPPDTKAIQSERTTYLTWSQSPPRRPRSPRDQYDVAQESAPDQRLAGDARDRSGVPRHQRGLHDELEAEETRQPYKRSSPRYGQWAEDKRPGVPAAVEVYRAPSAGSARRSSLARRSTTKTTVQSLPHGVDSKARDERHWSADAADDDYHTSDILRLRKQFEDATRTSNNDYLETRWPAADKENHDPVSSISIDRMLEDVRRIGDRPPLMEQPRTTRRDEVALNLDRMPRPKRPPSGSSTLPVRGEGRSILGTTPRRAVATRNSPNISMLDSRPPSFVQAGGPRLPEIYRSAFDQGHAPVPSMDDEMLDDGPTIDSLMSYTHQPVSRHSRQAHSHALSARHIQGRGLYEAQAGLPAVEHSRDWEHSEAVCQPEKRIRGDSVAVDFKSERSVQPASGVAEDNMAGFWKPNRLY